MALEQAVDQPQTPDTSSTADTSTTTTDSAKTTASSSSQGAAPDRKAEDDRQRGILADLQKERKARQEYERQVASMRGELDAERRRVQALAGVTVKSPEDTELETVRERLHQMFPALQQMTPEMVERLQAMAEQADSLQEATKHHWRTHGRQMLDGVTSAVAKELGGTLSDRQLMRIKREYVQEAEANPEFLARHEAGDSTLITEFVKGLMEDLFEPARRKITASELDRQRRVPSGRDRSVTGTGGKALDYNNPKAVEDALVASFRQHGGSFGE